MAVSHLVGAADGTQVLCKSGQCSALLDSDSDSFQFHVKVYLRLACLCLSWLLGRWKGDGYEPPYQGAVPHIEPLQKGEDAEKEPVPQGCGFNAKHPLAPKADNFAGSQVAVAGARGERTSCRRLFGWYSGKDVAGSVGCVPKRRETCRKACASRKKGEGE